MANHSHAPTKTNLADLIWKNAEVLTGAFKPAEYRKVILPMMILRRLDCLLEPTKAATLAMAEQIKGKNFQNSMFLPEITGYSFWNTSKFTFASLVEAPDELRENVEDMINSFSPNVAKIFEKFGFMATLDKLQEKRRLYLVVKNFANTPMDMKSVSAHDMGQAFEELLRRFNEGSPSDEQYTPRDAIHLMVDILFDGDDEALSVPGTILTMYDQTAGTGGMLSEAEEKVSSLNPDAKLRLYGQELEDETYAICMSDMLIRGQDPNNIAVGDTLGDDKHPDERFDYQLSNPPYGREWKPSEAAVKREHARGAAGRFGPGYPRISDGQMLFMLNALSKMRPYVNGKGGGKIGIVHNGSPLFTGDAGSGESEIRRYMLEKDYLDAIVALPTDMFYNTNIQTYLWFMSNRKTAERKGKVMLIDASGMGVLMKKNMGKKRIELSDDCRERIVKAYHDFKEIDWSTEETVSGRKRSLRTKVFDSSHFFYRKVTIERPLRMRFDLNEELLDTFEADSATRSLNDGGKLVKAIRRILETCENKSFSSADDFRSAIKSAADENSSAAGEKSKKLTAKQYETARKFFGIRDNSSDITTNEKGEPIPAADLRDAEYIPFEVIGSDIDTGIQKYFDAEVKPHWPDAWINQDTKDEADKQVGVVGCEINFNREFYVYQAPRSREAIKQDIESMEERFMEMLKGMAR